MRGMATWCADDAVHAVQGAWRYSVCSCKGHSDVVCVVMKVQQCGLCSGQGAWQHSTCECRDKAGGMLASSCVIIINMVSSGAWRALKGEGSHVCQQGR